MKTKTLTQLVQEWLELYPNDADDPDLEFNAVAGYVRLTTGEYMHWDTYVCERARGRGEGS